MTDRLEKRLQALIMVCTLVLGYFGSEFLSENNVYPLTVVAGPFIAGFLFVFLTRRACRADASCILFSVVGTIGLGAIGMILSNILDEALPHAWLVDWRHMLWPPVGHGTYVLSSLVLFIFVPIACFILGRILAERFTVTSRQTSYQGDTFQD